MPRLFNQLGRDFKTIQKNFLETEKRWRRSKTRTTLDTAYVVARNKYVSALIKRGLPNEHVGRLVIIPIETEHTKAAKKQAKEAWHALNNTRFEITKEGKKVEDTYEFKVAAHKRQLAIRTEFLVQAGQEYLQACDRFNACYKKLGDLDNQHTAAPAKLAKLASEYQSYVVTSRQLQASLGLLNAYMVSVNFNVPENMSQLRQQNLQNLLQIQSLMQQNVSQQNQIKSQQSSYESISAAYEGAYKDLAKERHQAIKKLVLEEQLYAAQLGVDDTQFAEKDNEQDEHSAKRMR